MQSALKESQPVLTDQGIAQSSFSSTTQWTNTQLFEREHERVWETGVFPSLDRVSGTLCLLHYVTEISHLYSSGDFWRHFGLCRAVAHSDCCFSAPCTYLLTANASTSHTRVIYSTSSITEQWTLLLCQMAIRPTDSSSYDIVRLKCVSLIINYVLWIGHHRIMQWRLQNSGQVRDTSRKSVFQKLFLIHSLIHCKYCLFNDFLGKLLNAAARGENLLTM